MNHDVMVSLVHALCVKTSKTGPEHMAYLRGIEFVEKLFIVHRLCLEKQIEQLGGWLDEHGFEDVPKSIQ